jgi:hypothetical protein
MMKCTKRISLTVTLLLTVFVSSVSFKKNSGDPPPRRAHHALVYDEANKTIVMTGGSTPVDGGQSFTFFNDLWSFDGKEWKLMGEAGDHRSGMALTFNSKTNNIISFGGFSGQSSLSDLRMLQGGQWKTISNPEELTAAEPGCVYDADRDRLIVFGGSKGRGEVNSITSEWDGHEWKKIAATGPAGRQAFAMIYDTKRKKTVLFGGMGNTPNTIYNDTWEYDGHAWAKLDSTGPAARMSMGYAYDSKRNLFLIFGGMSAQGMLGDTWAWDGKSWKKLSETGPAARAMGYIAYDKKRDRLVLFGGRIQWPNDANDTWEWDGNEWKEWKTQ